MMITHRYITIIVITVVTITIVIIIVIIVVMCMYIYIYDTTLKQHNELVLAGYVKSASL